MDDPPKDQPATRRQNPDSASSQDEAILDAVREAVREDDETVPSFEKRPQPSNIGPYRIVSVLGQGGMGRVYLAEQENPRRPVALKVVRGGRFVDEHYIRLFQREAQTLARLRHPGIAAIYDAGHTEDGQHFFAMELVRGQQLHEYVKGRDLSLPQRLVLLRNICNAINYAHQRGVIHRDLKPSNVIVDADGHPRVLDFGLAKITDTDVAVATVVTELGIIQGTLPYMSPEQARGNPDEIDLRSDVYSLGAILFELATGRVPHDVQHSVLHEAVRTICEDNPPRPSQYDRKLRGDLETIILKAIAKEPSRRYQSAGMLSEDIDRFLAGQPILARPPSTVYQFRKVIARHKAASALVLTLFVVVLGFGASMSILYAKANANLTRANRAIEFLAGLFRVSDPDQGAIETLKAKDVLVRDSERIATELKDEPATLAMLMDALATSFRNLGDLEQAMKFTKDATRIRRELYGDLLDRGSERIKTELKGEPATLAMLMDALATSFRNRGDSEQAMKLSQDALRIRRELYGEQHLSVAESKFTLARAWKLKGEYNKAIPLLQDALSTRRRLGAKSAAIAENLHVLGATLAETGEYQRAVPLLNEALDLQHDLYGKAHPDALKTLHSLAGLKLRIGQDEAAEKLARELLIASQSMLGDDHQYVAFARKMLASVLRERGAYEAAGAELQLALPILRKSMGDKHPFVGSDMVWQGLLLREQGRFAQSEPVLRAALALFRERLDDDHPFVAAAMSNLGWLLYDTQDYAAALAHFTDALDVFVKRMGERHARTADARLGLGLTLLARGNAHEAEAEIGKAVRALHASLPAGHWQIALTESAWGASLAALGRFDEAEPLLKDSLEVMIDKRGPSDRYVVRARQRLINLYKSWGKPAQADTYRTRPNLSGD